ncbi:hypothetical protein GXP70_16020 [Paenibacillus lycopersici]|uniref:Uncharacterized protein n=1 Tax=Paenibacillus lycopersici TaxID=2704462 RepID=A0A6C0G1V4_9BACL|nr:hypothetical protein [Paenibacillus lycopersici]QHT61314.1 hypothetical protein GXP70_16020 [Paenibacillus lycopersici]
MGEKVVDLKNYNSKNRSSTLETKRYIIIEEEHNNPKDIRHEGKRIEYNTFVKPQLKEGRASTAIIDTYLPFLMNSSSKDMSPKEGEEPMDEGYKKIIDRLDQDLRDFKKDISERDERIQRELLAREERFRQEATERESRARQDAKEREERILKALTDTTVKLENEMKDVKESVKRSEERIDTSTKHIQSLVTTNKWGNYATFIGVLAIFISIITCIITIWISND